MTRFAIRLGLLGALLAPPAVAEPVDLELVLAVDVSGSVDFEEAGLQRDGYIAAFGHPRIIQAIKTGFSGRIAVMYFEWAGYDHNRVIVPWTLIHDDASAAAFREALSQDPPQTARRTSISQAITFGAAQLDDNGFEGRRRVIDISGDGANNWGRIVVEARNEAVAAGMTINGLPIVNDRPSRFGRRQIPNLDLYYENCVIGGRSAFIVVAQGFEDFAEAVLRKLILEIAGVMPSRRPRTTGPRFKVAEERLVPSCTTGEEYWPFRDDF